MSTQSSNIVAWIVANACGVNDIRFGTVSFTITDGHFLEATVTRKERCGKEFTIATLDKSVEVCYNSL